MKKISPYILILLILVGLFGPMGKADAQEEVKGYCVVEINGQIVRSQNKMTEAQCRAGTHAPAKFIRFEPDEAKADAATKPDSNKNALYNSLTNCPPVDGCIAVIIYWLFYSIPSFLLGVVANFLNVIMALTIQSDLYTKATFIGNAWAVVRDLSNIFFILILLYIAIKTILGLGGSEVKKMIGQVIIMALLINFSMFFTKIIIDSSNILALVFYNKINVATVEKDGKIIDTNYVPLLAGGKDKDVTGKLMAYFDPTKILSAEFFDKFREKTYTFSIKGAAVATGGGAIIGNLIPIIGTGIGAVAGLVGYTLSGFGNNIPLSVSAGFIIVAGTIIIFAAYCFFIAGLSFLSRMIELWILIIFSPFAFMSSTVPKLAGFSYIGWEEWSKRLLKLSFMAPIFMFFLYLIFMIIQSNIFSGLVDRTDPLKQGWMETIILMVIPALVILILLRKATGFAQKASGELGGMIIGFGKTVAGLALGGAIGGGLGLAAKGMQGGLGRLGKNMAESKDMAKWATTDEKGWRGSLKRFAGTRAIAGGGVLSKSSFDARKGVIGGALGMVSKATGMKLSSDIVSVEAGGYEADLKKRDAKRKQRAEELKKATSFGAKEKLRDAEGAHQSMLVESSHAIDEKDRQIKAAEGNREAFKAAYEADKDNAEKKEKFQLAADKVVKLKAERKAIKDAKSNSIAESETAVKDATETAEIAAKALASDPSDGNKTAVQAAAQRLNVAKATLASAKVGGRSINDFEDEIIPNAKHEVHHEEQIMARRYAGNILENEALWANKLSPWRDLERKRSAHDIRMEVKVESHGDKGGGGSHLVEHAIIETLGQTLSGHNQPPASETKAGGEPPHK